MQVPPESLDHGHDDVCGAQAAGNWAGGRSAPLHMCFIDLQKAYDTVDRAHPPLAVTYLHVVVPPHIYDSSHPTIPRWDESLCAT